jgi:hypothetical protein
MLSSHLFDSAQLKSAEIFFLSITKFFCAFPQDLKKCDRLFYPLLQSKVARRYIFRPKNAIWINLEGLVMDDVGIFYGQLVYFMAN